MKSKTKDLLNYYIDFKALSKKQKESIYFNIDKYYIEVLNNNKELNIFYTNLFSFISNLPNIKEINKELNDISIEMLEIETQLKTTLNDEEYVEILNNENENQKIKLEKKYEELRRKELKYQKEKNQYMVFFNKDFYFLLNNLYFNFDKINKNNLFENFLKENTNDNFITLIIEYAKKNLNIELLKQIIIFYNLNKTQVNTILSFNVMELNLLLLKHHEDKILKYNDIYNSCFINDSKYIEELKKIDNKYINYIIDYIKRNEN